MRSASPVRHNTHSAAITDCAHPAVDDQFAADRIARFIGGEEHDRLRDLDRFAEAADQNLAADAFGDAELFLLHPKLAIDGRGDRSWAHNIHADSTRYQLARRVRASEISPALVAA